MKQILNDFFLYSSGLGGNYYEFFFGSGYGLQSTSYLKSREQKKDRIRNLVYDI